jgi:CheY-like chemotaxis protein
MEGLSAMEQFADGRAGPPRVLLVEDDPSYRRALHQVLVDEGIEVLGEAGDGLTGVQLAAELDPDVVLMDLRMPGMGGLEATRAIHQSAPTAQVIILTSYEGPLPSRSAEQAGAYAYLVKGCSASLIREVVGQAARYREELDLIARTEPASGDAAIDLFWERETKGRGASMVWGAETEAAGRETGGSDALAMPAEPLPDSVPDDFVEKYGREARQAVRYRASRRYRIAREAREQARILRDRDVWTTAVVVFGFSLFALAFIAALVYMVALWPWTGLFIVAPVMVLMPFSLWLATRIVRREREELASNARKYGF